MTATAIKLTPADNGRAMSLADFEHAEVQEGFLYELGRGVIVVSDVPNPPHLAQVNALRRLLARYDLDHPGLVYGTFSGSECKILLAKQESERHPDLAVYKTPPPGSDPEVWASWIPELVIEVVSEDSRKRDYDEKREEYLAFGVQEYWVVDADRQEVLALQRTRGLWVAGVVRPADTYRCRVLPELEICFGPVFEAAAQAARC